MLAKIEAALRAVLYLIVSAFLFSILAFLLYAGYHAFRS